MEVTMTQTYKLIYTLRNDDFDSKNFGRLTNKTVQFASFTEAVQHSRFLVNTHINLVGMPIVDLTLTEK